MQNEAMRWGHLPLAGESGANDNIQSAREARLRPDPYLVAFQNNSGVRDVYGGLAEIVVLESYLLKPKDNPSDTVLMFMHPIGGGAYLPMINALARAGHHVIYCNSRFRGTDSALLMEKVV